MRRLKQVGLLLATVLVVGAAMSSPTFAAELPVNLPVAMVARNWTGTTEGTFQFDGALPAPISCENAGTEGTEEAGKPLGLFHEHLKNCTAEEGKIKCTGTGEEVGVILLLGTWHLVFDRKKGGQFVELTTGYLELYEPVTFKCTVLLTVEVKGEQLCLHLKPTEKAFTHSHHCIAEANKQTEEWCKKDIGEKCEEAVVPLLLASVNKGAFKEIADLSLGSRTYGVELFADV